jgi:RimJ/RimL family protein N-acetyltransferase
MGDSWRSHGVHKWIAYDRVSCEVVGRGGLSRTPVDDDWGQIYALLPSEPWVRLAHENDHPCAAHAHWLEIGWALRRKFWGHGYASEMAAGRLHSTRAASGRVVHSLQPPVQAVMERIGMRCTGEIRSRGAVDGLDGGGTAPFVVCVLRRT